MAGYYVIGEKESIRVPKLNADHAALVKPSHYGAVGGGIADDTIALQAFWDAVIAGNLSFDCSGTFGISDIDADGRGLNIGSSAAPAAVPPGQLFGRMKLIALNAMNEMVRVKNLPFRKWVGGLYLVGTGSSSFASRTCLIGAYFENCSRLQITGGVEGENLALANVYMGTANNNMMQFGLIRGSNIGSGLVGSSLTANWSAPSNTGSSGSTAQRTTISLDAFPSAAIRSYEVPGSSPIQLRIAGYLYYVYSVDTTAGTASIYPWLDNTSFSAGIGTCEWVLGGNFCTHSSDSNLITVDELDASNVGRNLSEGASYGSIIRDMQTNGAGTEICIGTSPSTVAEGTTVLGRYNEGGGASSEQIVSIPRFGNSNYHLFLGDSGATDLSKCWATGDPRLTGGAINGGTFGTRGQGSIGVTKFGRLLQHHKPNLTVGAGSTVTLTGQTLPPIPVIYFTNSQTANLSVQGSGEYNRLFGYSGGIVGYFGTGTNGVPTGTITFAPPSGGTINGGAVDATVAFSGFTAPPLFMYEHTDTAQLTWQVRVLTGLPVARTLATAFADAQNTTTAETDLFSYTIPAGELAANGDRIEAQYAGTFVSSATATRQLIIKFAGTAFFDSGALTLSLSAAWDIYVTLIRVSSTVIRYSVSMTTEGAALAAYTACGELTGLTLSNTNILKITGTAAGVGAATGDIVGKLAAVDKRAA